MPPHVHWELLAFKLSFFPAHRVFADVLIILYFLLILNDDTFVGHGWTTGTSSLCASCFSCKTHSE